MELPAWAAEALIQAGRRCDRRGWVPATAGNFSLRLDGGHCAITQSGRHKGFLGPADLMVIGLDGRAAGSGRPSRDTPLHLALYRRAPAIGAIVHGHSVAATVLSRPAGPALSLRGYELQKALADDADPSTPLAIPVFDEGHDLAQLAAEIDRALDPSAGSAYLLRGHGAYVWAPSMELALARLEALEFMLACELEFDRRGR